jgi:hypothetical protein
LRNILVSFWKDKIIHNSYFFIALVRNCKEIAKLVFRWGERERKAPKKRKGISFMGNV